MLKSKTGALVFDLKIGPLVIVRLGSWYFSVSVIDWGPRVGVKEWSFKRGFKWALALQKRIKTMLPQTGTEATVPNHGVGP